MEIKNRIKRLEKALKRELGVYERIRLIEKMSREDIKREELIKTDKEFIGFCISKPIKNDNENYFLLSPSMLKQKIDGIPDISFYRV